MNGDLSRRVVVHTDDMEWTASPSGSVLRKRLHLVGEAESGQVTSVVRYLPGASFPEHPHPEGEEIFVLEGTFSDQLGHARAGAHLLNPEGFRHAPYSDEGCLIFVKLRQYSGDGREFHRTETPQLEWSAGALPGVEEKLLYRDSRFPDVTRLERWAEGARPGPRSFPGGAELFVIEGELVDGNDELRAGSWIRLPPGGSFDAESSSGCVLYLKSDGVAALRGEGDA